MRSYIVLLKQERISSLHIITTSHRHLSFYHGQQGVANNKAIRTWLKSSARCISSLVLRLFPDRGTYVRPTDHNFVFTASNRWSRWLPEYSVQQRLILSEILKQARRDASCSSCFPTRTFTTACWRSYWAFSRRRCSSRSWRWSLCISILRCG